MATAKCLVLLPASFFRAFLFHHPDQFGQEMIGVEMLGKKIIGTLSKGYQQRVGIAQAIVHNPEVIILDEPTVGLDPAQIRDIRTLIRELGDSHSVILSTHLLGEAESICDRVEIMQVRRMLRSSFCRAVLIPSTEPFPFAEADPFEVLCWLGVATPEDMARFPPPSCGTESMTLASMPC